MFSNYAKFVNNIIYKKLSSLILLKLLFSLFHVKLVINFLYKLSLSLQNLIRNVFLVKNNKRVNEAKKSVKLYHHIYVCLLLITSCHQRNHPK